MTTFYALKRKFMNVVALYKGPVKLWLDDIRHAPDGWYHATTVEEAQDVLIHNVVEEASFDHDLGLGKTGYDLCLWLAEQGMFWPEHKPTLHTANPVGRENMKSVIERYGPYNKN